MATSLNKSIPGRNDGSQSVQFLKFDVSYGEASISSGVLKGTLPVGAFVIGTDVLVTTDFDAGSTNVFTVGTNSTPYDNLVSASDVDETVNTLDAGNLPTGTALGTLTAPAGVYAKYTQTGTAATAGAATVVVKYVVGN